MHIFIFSQDEPASTRDYLRAFCGAMSDAVSAGMNRCLRGLTYAHYAVLVLYPMHIFSPMRQRLREITYCLGDLYPRILGQHEAVSARIAYVDLYPRHMLSRYEGLRRVTYTEHCAALAEFWRNATLTGDLCRRRHDARQCKFQQRQKK